MKKPLKAEAGGVDEMAALKHDIRNQVSNIQIAIEQLRYEITGPASDDSIFYMDMIASSCKKIDALLKNKDQL